MSEGERWAVEPTQYGLMIKGKIIAETDKTYRVRQISWTDESRLNDSLTRVNKTNRVYEFDGTREDVEAAVKAYRAAWKEREDEVKAAQEAARKLANEQWNAAMVAAGLIDKMGVSDE